MLTFHHATLPNGLTIVGEQNPDSHSFAAGVFVNTGARDEDPRIVGVSHFLEHMMFKGSTKYTWEDVNRIFDELGARYNAFTTQEMTAYYANVLPEFTEQAIEHLSHLLRPAIREADFTTEKKVILEEIAMYLDEPGHRLYEKLMEEHFAGHALARSVLGSAQSITDLTQPEMADYFGRRYGAANSVLAVAGRFDWAEILTLAKKYFGHWNTGEAGRKHGVAPASGKRFDVEDPKLNRSYTMGLTPGPSAQDEDRFAARLLADIIGDDDGSRLYWALVDNATAEDADFGFYPHDHAGSFFLALTCDPAKRDHALDIALSELERVKRDINADELTRAKNKIASQIVLQAEGPMGRMRSIGTQWLYNGHYRSLDQDMTSLLAVTPRTLQDLMVKYPFTPMTLVTLGPAAT